VVTASTLSHRWADDERPELATVISRLPSIRRGRHRPIPLFALAVAGATERRAPTGSSVVARSYPHGIERSRPIGAEVTPGADPMDAAAGGSPAMFGPYLGTEGGIGSREVRRWRWDVTARGGCSIVHRGPAREFL